MADGPLRFGKVQDVRDRTLLDVVRLVLETTFTHTSNFHPTEVVSDMNWLTEMLLQL